MASNDEQRSATTILTTAAQSIAARLIANETTAKFTKAEISTTNLFNQSVTELQVLTSLDNVQQTADINAVTVINNNTVNVNVAIDQTKAPNNYQMNSVGLFAVDGDGKEVLYSVTVLKDPVYIHQDAMGSALGIDLETVVGQASNVEISVNPAGAVTNEILKATLADYVKTDDSTVVHTADMRKPANQVASIDEVNTKQDKLTITPADDSKVVHTADMRKPASDVAGIEEVSTLQTQVNNSAVGTNLLINTSSSSTNGKTTTQGASTQIYGVYTRTNSYEQVATPDKNSELCYRFMVADINNLYGLTPGETYTLSGNASHTVGELSFRSGYGANGNWSGADVTDLGIPVSDGSVFTPFSHTFTIPVGATGVYVSLENYDYTTGSIFRFKNMKLEKGSKATDWCPNPDDKVNVADMRKPASDVAGIEEVNAKQDKLTITPADDSKVAHLSGANNFDTVPTVNNNPLLLASSLPSDLARTSQQTNFTAGLQSNGTAVATQTDVTTAISVATANMVDRNPNTGVVSEPVDFTNLTVNGGKSVATINNVFKYINEADESTALNNSKNDSNLHYVEE